MKKTNTIVAPSTPQGIGATGVVRLSGPDAVSIVQQIFEGRNLSKKPSHSLHFGKIWDGEKLVDEVVVGLFKAPQSYTGEDVVEISCHGSPLIIGEVVSLVVRLGATVAEPGEFTLRAFLNGKMDLSQAEAVADLITAENESSRTMAIQQMRGGFSNELKTMRQILVDFAALLELELDFSEEDVEFANRSQLLDALSSLKEHITGLLASFELGNLFKKGVQVAIVGKPNTGKSTLLNKLIFEERAIVSDIPGTTRDAIEEVITMGGIPFRFIDTAGLRDSTDTIEKIGIERAYEKIRKATLVVYVFDPSETPQKELLTVEDELITHTKPENILYVANKADQYSVEETALNYPEFPEIIYISALNNQVAPLTQALTQKVNIRPVNPGETIITNQRHEEALLNTLTSINTVVELLQNGESKELAAFEIKEALHHLGLITGEVTNDDLLANIFGKFCIGK